jgi:hypothetical protein
MLVKERQLLNMSDMFVTDAVFSKGIVTKELQAPNMPDMFVTNAVFSKGIVAKELQLLNMLIMLVTDAVLYIGTATKLLHPLRKLSVFVAAAVLNNGAVARALQLRNILLMFVTAEVLAVMTTCLKARKVENKEAKEVTLPMWRSAARSHIANLTFVPPMVNPEAVRFGPPISMSNHPLSYACRPVVLFFRFKSNVDKLAVVGVTLTMACL